MIVNKPISPKYSQVSIPDDILYEEIIKHADLDTLFQLYHTNNKFKTVINSNLQTLNDKYLGMYGDFTFYQMVMWYYYRKLKLDKLNKIKTLEGQLIRAVEMLDYFYNPERPGYMLRLSEIINFLNRHGFTIDVNNLDKVIGDVLIFVINKKGKYTTKNNLFIWQNLL
jgi:hypothetical protein